MRKTYKTAVGREAQFERNPTPRPHLPARASATASARPGVSPTKNAASLSSPNPSNAASSSSRPPAAADFSAS
ncbi:hypothetical protein [Herbidospora galbida]|uniref:hypothetical protein n=1 Tax=Herbidospora galbida TaxID=2575442 RepID=UPI001485863B|nr:hypothetical protein [Herbidospora galbida]